MIYVLMVALLMTLASIVNGQGKYAEVNGLRVYYEIHGKGEPLVLLHGGGSTIETSFGRVIPHFAKTRRVIAIERQAHGRTADRDTPATFEQDADDVAALLRHLQQTGEWNAGILPATPPRGVITKVDILGFSNGGHVAIEIALRHPSLVRKLILASTNISRDGMPPEFWKGMEKPKFSDLPQLYKDAFLKVNNDPAALMKMFERDSSRMRVFKGWTDEQIKSITAPVLLVNGDRNDILLEHVIRMHRLFPNSRLAILPGNHGGYMGEAMTPNIADAAVQSFVSIVAEFLN
jgi:pimeloyl-ACP methyl ester carboxylesterase